MITASEMGRRSFASQTKGMTKEQISEKMKAVRASKRKRRKKKKSVDK